MSSPSRDRALKRYERTSGSSFQFRRDELDLEQLYLLETFRSLDTRGGLTVTASGVVLTLGLRVQLPLWATIGVGLAFGLAALLALASLYPRTAGYVDPAKLQRYYGNSSAAETKQSIYDTRLDLFQEDIRNLEKRSRLLRWAFYPLGAGVVLAVIGDILEAILRS